MHGRLPYQDFVLLHPPGLMLAPFFLAEPSTMWRMVVSDQVARHNGTPTIDRLTALSSLRVAFPALHGTPELAALAAVGLVIIGVGLAAWRAAAASRLIVEIAAAITRRHNLVWPRDVERYLQSGDAAVLIRSGTGLSPATRAQLTRGGVLARSHGYVIYRTHPGRVQPGDQTDRATVATTYSSARRVCAAVAIACIFPSALSRGRYFMPQSVPMTILSGVV